MQIYEVTDTHFRKYGKVIRNIDFSALTEAMKKTPVPSDVVYEPSIAELEALPVAKEIEKVFYGELPIQIGYCNGHNVLLNAVEYHRSSEINLAATDAVLILGSEADVTDDFTYETSKVEAFLVPAGTGIEIYGTTLHYAPCGVDGNGFKAIYGQLMNVTVAEGDTITTAQNIGEVAPPSSYYTEEGTHVFFELMKNGVPINPMILMQ